MRDIQIFEDNRSFYERKTTDLSTKTTDLSTNVEDNRSFYEIFLRNSKHNIPVHSPITLTPVPRSSRPSKKEERKKATKDSEGDHAPFLGTVAATSAVHLFPRSIINVLSVFDFESNISKVHWSGGTILAALDGSRIADDPSVSSFSV